MNQPAQQDTSLELMQAFVAEHGTEALDERAGEPRAPQTEPASSGQTLPPRSEEPANTAPPTNGQDDSGVEGGGDGLLDEATLQALGLAPEGQPALKEDGETEGTTQQQVDLAALANTLGLEESDLSWSQDGLRLKTKVDGESGEVSLAELRKGYQLQSHFTRQQEQFLAERQQWEQARQQQEQQLQQQAAFATEVLNAEEQQLNAQYTRDWNQLRQDDPAEYAAQVAEYNQKLGQIRGRQQNLMQTLQKRQQEQAQQQQAQMREYLQKATQTVSEGLGWKDEKAWKDGFAQLSTYMTKNGFSVDEMNQIVDPRAIILSEKARKYDELMSRVELSRKKVAETHKMPSGNASKPTGSKRRKLDAAQQRLAKEGTDNAAAEVFRQLGVV